VKLSAQQRCDEYADKKTNVIVPFVLGLVVIVPFPVTCRCRQNCDQEVNRKQVLELVAHCSASASDAGWPCSGKVRWSLTALSVTSHSSAAKDHLWRHRDWTTYAVDGGALWKADSHALPHSRGFITYEIRASGQSAYSNICRFVPYL